MPFDSRATSYVDENLADIWRDMHRIRSWAGDLKDRPEVPHLDKAMMLVGYNRLHDYGFFRMWLVGYLVDKTEGDISKLHRIVSSNQDSERPG